jgi:hypothetical protein
MSDLRSFTLWARDLLTQETADLLQQVYRLDAQTGARLPIPKGHLLETSTEAQANQKRIENLLDDEVDAGLNRVEAVAKLAKETAFTHLNRFVAFKLLEARGLVRSPLARRHEANGFKMWLGNHPADETLYNQGDSPNNRDGFGEAPRDRAYRHFLLWQCTELAKEIKVLFDPDNVPSLLFPRPGALKELIHALNADERKTDWAAGNEETVGWVYQYFNSEELEAAFAEARLSGKKFAKEDIPSVTQLFTPRTTVRFLVDNTLGRLWLSMHPDSRIADFCPYLTPLPADPPAVPMKPVNEIRVLDPANGTMHFGLVAFDLLVEMYREELDKAGRDGWPPQPSIQNEADIPAAILANNLYGIDIDLRAVQLAALALFLKAKVVNKTAVLTQTNLACTDVAIFRGQHLNKIISEMALPGGITRELFVKLRDSLEEASMMGSLVRLEKHFQNLQSERLRQTIDAYIEKKRAEGVDESYFAHETGKGLRLLEVLERRYDVVFTNPPYVSARKMNPDMSRFMKVNYKNAQGDLYAAFIQRCLELTSDSGLMGMLTMHSFMFIRSYKKLRALLAENSVVDALAHYGPGLFAVGNPGTLQTAAFVLRREQLEMERREARGVYFRLVKDPEAESKRTVFEHALACRRAGQPDSHVYEYRQGDFAAIPGSPWVYWITPGLRRLFLENKSLGEVAAGIHGTATYDNFRFLRYWWEVKATSLNRDIRSWNEYQTKPADYVPYMKGGSFQRWYGNQEYVLQMLASGRALISFLESKRDKIRGMEEIFRRGVTWTDLTTGKFNARLSPGGFIFDVSGSSVFPDDVELVLAVMNSTWAQYALKLINPTVHVQVGDLARLPLPKQSSALLRDFAERAIALARVDSEEDETTYDFVEPPVWPDGAERVTARHRDLACLETEIDEEVYRLYEISPEDRRAIEEELAAAPMPDDEIEESKADNEEEATEAHDASFTVEELAQRWVSYAVGIALGRFTRDGLERAANTDGLMVINRDHPDDLAQRVIDILVGIHTDAVAGRIVRTAIGGNGDLRDALASYLKGAFFKNQMDQKRYRKRPVYWLLQSPKHNFSAYLFHERATDQTLALLQGKRYLGGRIFQVTEQLNQAKQKELTTEGKEKAQWKRKSQEWAEELSDLEAFQQAIDATNSEPVVNADGQSSTARWVPEFDDGILLNVAPLYRLTPAWKKADAKLDLSKVWNALKGGKYPWAKTAMRYWPRETLAACKENKSYRIAHGLE